MYLVTFLIPVSALLLGVFVLGERVDWTLFLGMALIFAGLAAGGRRRTSAALLLCPAPAASAMRSARQAQHSDKSSGLPGRQGQHVAFTIALVTDAEVVGCRRSLWPGRYLCNPMVKQSSSTRPGEYKGDLIPVAAPLEGQAKVFCNGCRCGPADVFP